MKAVQIVNPQDLRIIDIKKPALDERNNVLVRMTAAGICGSDGTIYHGTNAIVTYPRIIGHEMVGVVEETGANVRGLQHGDRVIINQVVSCGHCYPCQIGRGNVCDDLKVRGVHIDGGFREYIAVPESDCCRLPDSLSDCDAVMIEPATIAIQACSRAQLAPDDMLLILGYGALGSSVLRIARLLCSHIIVACRTDEKLEAARQNGALYTINVRKRISNKRSGNTPADMAPPYPLMLPMPEIPSLLCSKPQVMPDGSWFWDLPPLLPGSTPS